LLDKAQILAEFLLECRDIHRFRFHAYNIDVGWT
jgi:hypothetical protein